MDALVVGTIMFLHQRLFKSFVMQKLQDGTKMPVPLSSALLGNIPLAGKPDRFVPEELTFAVGNRTIPNHDGGEDLRRRRRGGP